MRTREQRREEERQYEGDVAYDVWKNGGDPDRVSHDRIQEHFYLGDESESATRDELRHQKPQPQEQEQEEVIK